MKLPRDLGGEELAHSQHKPLKVGTLNRVLNEIAQHLGMDKQELLRRLFP